VKKNIVIGVLLVITVLSSGYGYYQKRKADRCILLAEQLATKAEMFRKEAEMERITAQFQRRKAEGARNEALQAFTQVETRK
jgi:hypothetical protein